MSETKHLLGIQELTSVQIQEILGAARRFSQSPPKPLLQGKTIVNLFFENSTRTRTSFELAIRKLGGQTLNFSASTSSVKKGETLMDTAKTIQAMNPNGMVVRHPSAGSPWVLASHLKIPIINAGDGFHEHPTQALADAFTIQEKIGSLQGKKVTIVGDIAHSRVARSNIHLLQKLGASVTVCGPPTLMPPKAEPLGIRSTVHLKEALQGADVVMALRIQLERQNRMLLPSIPEYTRFWGILPEHLKLLKPETLIMHPGPMNRGVEIDPEVADSSRSVILDQVSNGLNVRMAVLALLICPEGIK